MFAVAGVGDVGTFGVDAGVPDGDRLGRPATVWGAQAESMRSAIAPLRSDFTFLDTTIRGAVRLRGGPWEMEIRPERGGRITSLRLAGDELLDQGIGVDDPSAPEFVAAGAFGWDELVPTVEVATYPAQGPFLGVHLPDHGEAWRHAWTVLEEAPSFAAMQCSGNVLPWRLRRRMELGASAVRATYVFQKQDEGDASVPSPLDPTPAPTIVRRRLRLCRAVAHYRLR